MEEPLAEVQPVQPHDDEKTEEGEDYFEEEDQRYE
jgi:hypothetical protein